MNVIRPKKDIVEIFGYAPNDTSKKCRALWELGACPFTGFQCSKFNHDKSIVYGVCSVTTPYGDCIICPNRFYANKFETLRHVARDAFGYMEFMTFPEYVNHMPHSGKAIVALGMYSGHEIGTKSFSFDWILAYIYNNNLISYTAAEVQSLDITGNYRDTWHAYKNISENVHIPSSAHGLNWANVYKRLIPQIIRKGLICSHSKYVKSGLYFIVPDIVYSKFESVIGTDIPMQNQKAPDVITIITWSLGRQVPEGNIRRLKLIKRIRCKISDFSERFISGPNLPNHNILDETVAKALGCNVP